MREVNQNGSKRGWETLGSSSATTSHSWHSGVLAVGIITDEQQPFSHADSQDQHQFLPVAFTSHVDPHCTYCPKNKPPASCT